MNFLRWHRRGGEAPAGSGEVAIVAAAGQIVGLGLVAVGLALEADAVIGLDAVAVAHHEHQPLGGVPQEEGQEEQFALLGGVYALVVKFLGREVAQGKYEATKIDGQEIAAEGQLGTCITILCTFSLLFLRGKGTILWRIGQNGC